MRMTASVLIWIWFIDRTIDLSMDWLIDYIEALSRIHSCCTQLLCFQEAVEQLKQEMKEILMQERENRRQRREKRARRRAERGCRKEKRGKRLPEREWGQEGIGKSLPEREWGKGLPEREWGKRLPEREWGQEGRRKSLEGRGSQGGKDWVDDSETERAAVPTDNRETATEADSSSRISSME